MFFYFPLTPKYMAADRVIPPGNCEDTNFELFATA